MTIHTLVGSSPRRLSRALGIVAVAAAFAGAVPGGCAGTNNGNGGAAGENGAAGGNGAGGDKTGAGGATGGTAGSGGSTPGTGGGSPPGTGGAATGSGGGVGAGGRSGTGGAGAGGAAATGGSSGGGTGGNGGNGGNGGSTGGNGPEVWVSPTGSDTNAGTQAAPFLTIQHAQGAITAGGTIWLMAGTYQYDRTVNLSLAGSANNVTRLWAVPGGARPVLDFSQQARNVSSNRGFTVPGSYWHLKGFEVKNAGDNCINISGSNNTVEWVEADGCDDTGIQITASGSGTGSNNLILNCDAHDNFDTATGGENADGIDAKLNIGPGNILRGCRSWNNADDGYDLFGVTQVVTIDGCWAIANGQTSTGMKGANSDGNGFKLGGNGVPAVHVVTRSFAVGNVKCGYTLNNNTATPDVSDSGALANNPDTCSITIRNRVTITMTAAQAIAAQRDANGNLPAVQ